MTHFMIRADSEVFLDKREAEAVHLLRVVPNALMNSTLSRLYLGAELFDISFAVSVKLPVFNCGGALLG
jgi:hypothetical protein